MQSAFGVEHMSSVVKADKPRAVAEVAGGVAGGSVAGQVAHNYGHKALAKPHLRRTVRTIERAEASTGTDQAFYGIVAADRLRPAERHLARMHSLPHRRTAGVAGALVGGSATLAHRRKVAKSAFGVEARSGFGVQHELAKGVRPDKMIEAAAATGRKGKLKPLATPLADAKLGPRVSKSAFGVVHKGPLAAADGVALAPGRVKAVTATVRPGQAIPSATKKPLTERLNGAIAATGGSPS